MPCATKELQRAAEKRWRDANPEKLKAKVARRRARDLDGVRARARAASKRRDPEKVRAHGRATAAKRRHAQLSVGMAGILEAQVLRDRPCVQCGAPGPSQIDHMIPLAWARDCQAVRDVLGHAWAYQPLCRDCNLSKRDTFVAAFVPTGDIGERE